MNLHESKLKTVHQQFEKRNNELSKYHFEKPFLDIITDVWYCRLLKYGTKRNQSTSLCPVPPPSLLSSVIIFGYFSFCLGNEIEYLKSTIAAKEIIVSSQTLTVQDMHQMKAISVNLDLQIQECEDTLSRVQNDLLDIDLALLKEQNEVNFFFNAFCSWNTSHFTTVLIELCC